MLALTSLTSGCERRILPTALCVTDSVRHYYPIVRALKNYRYFHFIGVVRRHYRAFTRRSGNDV